MKKRKLLVSIVMLIIIALAITSASLAWFPVLVKAAKSLDYVTYSKTIVSINMSRKDFKARVYPAQAMPGAVSLGKDIGNIFIKDGTDNANTNIQTIATIAASKLNLAYYGNDENSGTMEIICNVTSKLPNQEKGIANKDISYMVCAQGYGLTFDKKWVVDPNEIPVTTYWQETRSNVFSEYNMKLDDRYYLLATNASHKELSSYFGINNYKKICQYNISSGAFSDFDDENYAADTELKTAIQENVNNDQFTYKDKTFFFTKNGDIYTVNLEDSMETIATSKEMNLDFLVLIWYNKVDELLDPAMALGETNVSIVVEIK